MGTRDKTKTYRIGIHHENILVERRVNADDIPHLMVNLEFERAHRRIKVHTVQVMEQQDLGVTLPTITGLLGLSGLAGFDDNNIPINQSSTCVSIMILRERQKLDSDLRHDVSLEFVQSRIDLSIVQLLGALTHTLEPQWLRVKSGIHTENV
jgi:hypothetical protein